MLAGLLAALSLAALTDLGRQSRHKADTVLGRWGLGQIADASPGLAALVQGGRVEPACQATEREPDDEIIVTAPVISVPGPAQGEMPSPEFIVQIYNAEHRGAELYEHKRYRQALPYLRAAAKRGFKWSQASLADIYLYGRGGVPKDLEAGIGWLGVAAEPVATSEVEQHFLVALRRLPRSFAPRIDGIINDYRTQYGAAVHRVWCEWAANGNASMRVKHLDCRFKDEVHQCREADIRIDPETGKQLLAAWYWTCPPINDSARQANVRI